jgi:hypothetical protein
MSRVMIFSERQPLASPIERQLWIKRLPLGYSIKACDLTSACCNSEEGAAGDGVPEGSHSRCANTDRGHVQRRCGFGGDQPKATAAVAQSVLTNPEPSILCSLFVPLSTT